MITICDQGEWLNFLSIPRLKHNDPKQLVKQSTYLFIFHLPSITEGNQSRNTRHGLGERNQNRKHRGTLLTLLVWSLWLPHSLKSPRTLCPHDPSIWWRYFSIKIPVPREGSLWSWKIKPKQMNQQHKQNRTGTYRGVIWTLGFRRGIHNVWGGMAARWLSRKLRGYLFNLKHEIERENYNCRKAICSDVLLMIY